MRSKTTTTSNPPNTLWILITLMTILLMPSAFADAEQYLTPGVVRDNTYVQDGTGQWAGRTPITYIRTQTMIPYSTPLVADLDNNSVNEIILAETSNIQILNFTSGTGMTLQDDYAVGSHVMNNINLMSTPGLINYNGGSDTEIVYFNSTSVFTLNYSNGSLTLIQSVDYTLINNTGSITAHNEHFPVKCLPGNTVSTGDDTCVFLLINRTGAGTYAYVFTVFNLDDGTIFKTQLLSAEPTNFQMQAYHNFHVTDSDNDGYNDDVLFMIDEAANGDADIQNCEVDDTPTCKVQQHENRAAGTTYTDIVVNRLDAVNNIATWGYMISNNMYAKSIKLYNNITMTDGYTTILTAPEGNYYSENWIVADDTTYCDYSGDVYMYVRNYDQSDPGANKDTVFCVSQYAGEGYEESVVTNTKNDTHSSFRMHQADLFGTTGLLLSQWLLQGSSKQDLPSINNDEVVIPVDYKKGGVLDMIGSNTSRVIYYDSNYVNSNWQISSLTYAVNPICQSYTYTYTVEINDSENDAGNCYATELYPNSTVITNFSAQSFTSTPSSVNFFYYADTTGNYILQFYCKDQYHTAYVMKQYSVLVSNDTSCNLPGNYLNEQYVSNATSVAEQDFEQATDDFWSGLGAASKTARNLIALFICLLAAVLVYMKTGNGMLSTASIPVLLMMCYFAGLATIFPVVVMLIVTVAWLVYSLVGGRNTTGG